MGGRTAACWLAVARVAGNSWVTALAKDSAFACADGSRSIPAAAVNDNYCDCGDGSDEPGTGACAGTSSTHFACENKPSTRRLLYLSRVGDGVCDCCDGSDEASAATGRPDLCPNTCKEEAVLKRAERERRRKEVSDGLGALKEAQDAAGKKAAAWRAELEEVQKNLTDLTRERDGAKAREKEARAQKEAEDAARAATSTTAAASAAPEDQTATTNPSSGSEEGLELPHWYEYFEADGALEEPTPGFRRHGSSGWVVVEGGGARVVDDPDGRRGRVLAFSSCTWGGDVISRDKFHCSVASKCRISFWARGALWQGFAATRHLTRDRKPKRTTEPTDAHSWLAVPGMNIDPEYADRLLTIDTAKAGEWTYHEYEFPGKDEFQMSGAPDKTFATHPVHIMLQAHVSTGHCEDTMVDDIRIYRDDAVKFKDTDGDELEFCLSGDGSKFEIFNNNAELSLDAKDLYTTDGGTKLHFLEYKATVPPGSLHLAQKAVDIFKRRGGRKAEGASGAAKPDDGLPVVPGDGGAPAGQAEVPADATKKDEPDVSEYAKWALDQDAKEKKEEPEVSEYAKWALDQDGKASPPEEDEEPYDPYEGEGDDEYPGGGSPAADEDLGSVDQSTAEGRLKVAEHALQMAEKLVTSAEGSKRGLTDKLKLVDDNDARFHPMMDTCVEKYLDKYLYKICFSGEAKQGSTRLGRFKSWDGSAGDGSGAVHFANGDVCWQGPARTLEARLTCGAEPELLEITEPSQCVYKAEVVHPCACTEAMLAALAEESVSTILPHEEL